jgi:hypothetical protein
MSFDSSSHDSSSHDSSSWPPLIRLFIKAALKYSTSTSGNFGLDSVLSGCCFPRGNGCKGLVMSSVCFV